MNTETREPQGATALQGRTDVRCVFHSERPVSDRTLDLVSDLLHAIRVQCGVPLLTWQDDEGLFVYVSEAGTA